MIFDAKIDIVAMVTPVLFRNLSDIATEIYTHLWRLQFSGEKKTSL